jgi:hypothetical protein
MKDKSSEVQPVNTEKISVVQIFPLERCASNWKVIIGSQVIVYTKEKDNDPYLLSCFV